MSSLSKHQIQFIRSFRERKVREETNSFVVEGVKIIEEILTHHFDLVESVYTTEAELFQNITVTLTLISEKELARISALKTPNKALAIVKKPRVKVDTKKPIVLALDGIQDPGNMGTIIRTADWFGVDHIICSKETVDCFNPKVIQSSMGSIFRINVEYTDLNEWLRSTDRVIYAAALSTEENAFDQMLSHAVLIIGSEGRGVSKEILSSANSRVMIPGYGGAESLNAAVATGIILSEFSRQKVAFKKD